MITIRSKVERAREIIDTYRLYEKFSEEHVYELSTLTGVDLENVCKVRNPKTGKDDRFLVVRMRGEPENYVGFSWSKRIRGKNGDKAHRTREVLRNTVWHQLSNFKANSEKVCFFCGCESDDLHVDHCWPSFDRVMREWIEKNGEPEIVKSKSGCGHVFAVEDTERSWQKHHYDGCSFQLLCSKCNIRKSDNESLVMGALWVISQISRAGFQSYPVGGMSERLTDILLGVGSKLEPVGNIYRRYE